MTTSQEFESYLPVYDTIPETWEEGRQFLVEHLKKISNAVNNREIAWLLDEELLTGQRFIPGIASPPQFRSVLRKVIDTGALPNTGIKSVAHGIVFDNRFTLLHFYGAATDPVAFVAIPLPTPSSVNTNIQIDMNATNVNIRTTFNASNFTRSSLTIEYIQEL